MDPRETLSPPVKWADGSKLLTDLQDIRARWKEYFNNLLNHEESAHPDACQQMKRKPTWNELCGEITMEELRKLWSQQHLAKHLVWMVFPQISYRNGGEKMCEVLLDLFNRCLSMLQLSPSTRETATVQSSEAIEEYHYWPYPAKSLPRLLWTDWSSFRKKFSRRVSVDSGLAVPPLTWSSLCTSSERRQQSNISHYMLPLLTSQRYLTPLTAQPSGRSLKPMDALISL